MSSAAVVGAVDASDEEVDQLLKELESSVGGPHAAVVMRDAVWAIEHRALSSCDPLSRDLFLEQRIRDVLSEFSRTSDPKKLLLAVDFVDALLSVSYTNPQQKFMRLCRSLFIVLHCGIEEPAREAQRVLKRMLMMDLNFPSFDPPLKLFITKELKDNCELALIQLHGRAHQTKGPHVAQFLAVMLALAATAEVNPRYMANQLRRHAVQLATALAGSSDDVLRRAAYECLVAIFTHKDAMRHNEIVLENRRVLDDAIRSLNTSNNNESSIVSTLQSLRALISSRGLHCIAKQVQILPQLCVLVTEQHRVSKSVVVRNAVCNLVPVIAESDILSPARQTTYCAIIMEPVKNVRDEKSKSLELCNVAIFIQNVGYEMLDPTNRTNLDSILMRYITRRETQEECWHIMAAICSSQTLAAWKRVHVGSRSGWSTNASLSRLDTLPTVENVSFTHETSSMVDGVAVASGTNNGYMRGITKQQGFIQHVGNLVQRCIPHMEIAVLSDELVRYTSILQDCIPSVSSELQVALDNLVDRKLKDDNHDSKQADVECIISSSRECSVAVAPAGATYPRQEQSQLENPQVSTFGGSNSAVGRLAQYFLPQTSYEGCSGSVNRCGINGGSSEPCGLSVRNDSERIQCGTVLDPLNNGSMVAGVGNGASTSHSVSASELRVALELFAKRQITTVQQLDEMRTSILHYQRHQDAQVRQQCSTSVVEVLTRWTQFAKQQRTSTYSTRVTEILELYLKHVVMEVDPKVRLMELSLLANAVELRQFLREQRILKTLMSLIHDAPHVRVKMVEVLVALTQEPKPGPSVEMVQQALMIMVESSVVALEYSSETCILIHHMSDLQTLARLSLNPLMERLQRIFIAFRKRLVEESVADAIVLSILKTLHTIIGAIECEEEVMMQHQDVVAELYFPVVSILQSSTSMSLSHAAISALVKMHVIGASPKEWNASQLHDVLQSITSVYIGSTNSAEELVQVLTLFGQLGAVDPSTKPDTAAMKKKDDEAAIQDDADLELTYDYMVIVYRDLSRMLDLSLSETVCTQVMHTLLHLVQISNDKKELVGGVHAVKAVLQIAKRATDTPLLRIEALYVMAAIISLRHEKISKTLLQEIVVLFEQLWHPHDHALFRAVLDAVHALKPGNLSGKEQSEVWPWLYPRLVDVALQDRTDSREFCLRVLGIILQASCIPPHSIPLVFPMLMHFMQQLDQLVEVRSLSLCVAIHVVCDLKAVQHLSSLLHAVRALTRHCELTEDLGPRLSTPMVLNSLRLLAAMCPGGTVTIQALRAKLREPDEVDGNFPSDLSTAHDNGKMTMGGDQSSLSYLRRYNQEQQQQQQQQLELQRSNRYLNDQDDEQYDTCSHGQQDITLFMKHVELGLRVKDKWREWFSEFQKNIIVVSPHPVFRIMVDLFDKHEPLRRKLFHPSFKCFYESLNAEHMKKVKEVLNFALRSSDCEVVSKCLGLADYLDHNPPSIREPVLQQLRSLENNDTVSRNNNNSNVFNLHCHRLHALASGQQGKTISENFNFESPLQSLGSSRVQKVSPQQDIVDFASNPLGSANTGKNGTYDNNSSSNNNNNNNNNANLTRQSPTEDFGGDFNRVRNLITGSTTPSLSSDVTPTWCPTSPCSRTLALPNKANPLFSTESLVEAAQRTKMYDKVMSYLESNLMPAIEKYRYKRSIPKEAVQAVVLPLAWLYSSREMQDSVVGLFRATRYRGENEDGFSYELMQWWDVAQSVYASKVQNMSKSTLVDIEGYIRTLCLCGEWENALHVARTTSVGLSKPSFTVAHFGAMAAWILGKWGDFKHLTELVPSKEKENAVQGLFLKNVVYFHDQFHNQQCDQEDRGAYSQRVGILCNSITRAKMEVDESLKTLLPLSYAHAYENLTMLQHFTEMEEQIAYVKAKSSVFRDQLVERWKKRFTALKPDSLMPNLRCLMLHSLVLQPNEMSEMVVKFCERMGPNYPQLSKWAMTWLQKGEFPFCNRRHKPVDVVPSAPSGLLPSVAMVYIGQVWSEGRRQEAIQLMENFLSEMHPTLEEEHPQCYGSAQLRLGTWKQDMYADSFWKSDHRQEVLLHFHEAIRAVPESWETWHSWGLMNYRVQQRDQSLGLKEQRLFVEAAHQGFVAAICRSASPSTALPGVMRLLQLWVFHNGVSLLKESVADSISRIPTDYWVQAIPQLIGHMSNSSHDVRDVISMILRQLCEVHSQAVVFPLLVVLMSDDGCGSPQLCRRKSAQSIIKHLPKRICADAELVAKLLVDVSAIPIEKIRENLSAVATAWNPNAEYEEDSEEVWRRLKLVLEIFDAHRRHLLYTVGDIGQYVEVVMEDEKRGDRVKARNIVGQLVDEITKHIAEKLGKEPQKAMEPLLNLRNLSIAVFGEYDIQYTNFPTIASFSSKLDVIPSKKRPRRIRLSGSNGFMYIYCLKGNEDIRMDERVMQLFGMINVLLKNEYTANGAFIHRFPVIPISNNVGLLGWVKNANTINNTICIHRKTISNVRANQESSVLRGYVESFGNWEKLSMIQRTEVLEYVMTQPDCEAVDVARAMWHRSNTAEQWLERRTAFTQSLATMSMVGYVLGLGDRHLGNILLSMSTGKIVHIDFGDSFDVSRLRHVLPETIPFRLTRMLTNAMEVFGVDGVFRSSCDRTQTTLYKNRDSIMALLSAFVHDPIVQHKGKMKNMMEKSRTPQDIAERIRNKLRGTEMAVEDSDMTIFNTVPESARRPDLLYMSNAFNDAARRSFGKSLTPQRQVSMLIDEATRVENYAALYFGWGPLW